jgi:AraC-like DNA-binding protein/quercetin dioxygenase-like cupin family protein
MRDVAARRGRGQPTYSLSDEHVGLDPGFPVFMFSFSLSREPITNLHRHDVLEIGLCVKGNGVFIIGNSLQPYEEGDLVVISPGQYHRAKSGTGMDDLWYFIYFNPEDWCDPGDTRLSGRLIGSAEDLELLALTRFFIDEMVSDFAERRIIVGGLIEAMVGRLLRLERSSPQQLESRLEKPRVIDDRINAALDFMISSESHDYGILELAGRCNLSEAHFRHLFKQQIGMSPKRFKTKLQINTAMNMLKHRSLKIVDISEKCGFESLSSFNRLFSKETGLSPSQWRAQQNPQ